MAASDKRTAYHPGDTVPTSGIYDVLHDKNHLQPHQVTCIKGAKFPPCHGCGDKVVFCLAKAALHLSEDNALNSDGDPNEGIDPKSVMRLKNTLNAIQEAVKGIYSPGMTVVESGIYDVLHDKNHKEHHQVTCVRGDKFPPCHGCTSKVRFRINTPAKHITDEAHLMRP